MDNYIDKLKALFSFCISRGHTNKFKFHFSDPREKVTVEQIISLIPKYSTDTVFCISEQGKTSNDIENFLDNAVLEVFIEEDYSFCSVKMVLEK